MHNLVYVVNRYYFLQYLKVNFLAPHLLFFGMDFPKLEAIKLNVNEE